MSIKSINNKFNLLNSRIKYGTDGGINIDEGSLFVNQLNGRVGIGTISPNSKLEIKQLNSSGLELGNIQFAPNPNYDPSLRFYRDISTSYTSGIGRLSWNCLDASNNPREVCRLQAVPRGPPSTSSNLFRRGDLEVGNCNMSIPEGNLGIGVRDVSSSSIKLALGPSTTSNIDVLMSINCNSNIGKTGINFDVSNNTRWAIRSDTSSNTLFIQDQSSNPLLLLNQNGNVGIGTSTPTNTLEVTNPLGGDSRVFIEGNSRVTCSVSRFGTAPRFETYRARGTKASPTILSKDDEIAQIAFLSYNGVGTDLGSNGYVRNAVIYPFVRDVSGTTITPSLAFGLGTDTATNQFRMIINNSGEVAIGRNTTEPITTSAILELNTTTKGFLPPKMTTAQKNAISSPAEGLMIYDTDLKRPCFYNGTSWITL